MFPAPDYLDLSQTAHPELFNSQDPVWNVLKMIEGYLAKNLTPAMQGQLIGNSYIGDHVRIGEGTIIEPGAVIKGPAWIGRNCQIRPGAYIRNNVIIGDNCVVGNSSEIKNAVLFNGCQIPHFNYVGDSILGAKAHLGAGVILSNFKLMGDEVVVRHDGERHSTGLRKFGAIIGDGVEIGCHAVLNPGSIIGRKAIIYPGVVWRGVLLAHSTVKNRSDYQVIPSRD